MKLVFEVSKKADGNMSWYWGEVDEVKANREKWMKNFGLKSEEVVELDLKQPEKISWITEDQKGTVLNGNGALTRKPGIGLFVVVADCYPVVFFDPRQGIVGLAHLGRKDIDCRLGQKMVDQLLGAGTRLEDVVVKIGPGIKKESYSWRGEVPISDPEWEAFLDKREDGVWLIDEFGFLLKQLRDKGVVNIEWLEVDTVKDEKYFSHVRSYNTGEKEGRCGVVAVMVEA